MFCQKSVFITRQTTFHALHTVMMTSGNLYLQISNAVAVVTGEIIQIRRGKEKTPIKWESGSGESMSPILPMSFLL